MKAEDLISFCAAPRLRQPAEAPNRKIIRLSTGESCNLRGPPVFFKPTMKSITLEVISLVPGLYDL